MKIKVLVHEAEEGGYWGEVPALPGCASQGETVEELLGNLREAIEGWLTTDADEGVHPVPKMEAVNVVPE
jgi:predicted RNase H-like HicB family nuclease